MKKSVAADVVIFGGGIAGLWLLNRLRRSGLSAILFESSSLGGGQTHKAQGIIHGGMKYLLQGMITKDAKAMADIPEIWRDCLAGKGEVDLSDVPILSPQQYLWAPNKFASKFTGFLASTALTSKVEQVAKENYPSIFQNPGFKGDVYALNELVLDVHILIRELIKENQDAVFKIEPLGDEQMKFDDEGNLLSATVYQSGMSVEVNAQQFIFTAGTGNEVIIKRLKHPEIAMQRRPLHMVLVKTPFNFPLYAHCLGLGPRPRITITTHHAQDGGNIWYLGGELAEKGVGRNSEAQIKMTRDELRGLFPWLNFAGAEYATFMVDRAEPKQKNGLKPESSYVKQINNIQIAWPTKLALAPKLSQEILANLQAAKVEPALLDTRELRAWPMPPIAVPVWEDAFCKSVA